MWTDNAARHFYLIKNIRGIIYFSEDVNIEQEISWLKRKFKYRELGASETLSISLMWRKLMILPKIVESRELDSILQASKFLCPLIVLKEKSLGGLEKAVTARLRTKDKLGDKDLKFNIRLVNYAITDFYLKSIELAKTLDIEGRKKLAERDLKRFWRIKPNEEGKTIIAYLDPLLISRDISDPIYMSLVPSIILDLSASEKYE
ncbi:MAG: hypothetical protein RMK50_06635 [Nitrososphaerota archaeon]|nr:hypothetical protein [Candidatus Bathyarchaeota archaeon]MDW8194478.1 hypothetical protein [Nitrososphaerota archaeon]